MQTRAPAGSAAAIGTRRTNARCTRCSPSCASRTGHDFSNYKRGTVLRRHRAAHGVREIARRSPTYAELPARAPGRGAGAAEGPADQRHAILPRRRGLRGAGAAGDPEAVRGQEARTIRCASGWPAAPPARRRTRWRCCCRSTPSAIAEAPDRPDLRDRHRRAGDRDARARASTRSTTRPTSRRSGCGGSSVKEGEFYRVRKELREMVLFAQHNLSTIRRSRSSTWCRAATC